MAVASEIVEMVLVERLKESPFNPRIRVAKSNLSGLLSDIRMAGRILVPLQVTRDYYVADGHRRLACAKILGMAEVPVLRLDRDLFEMWSLLNRSTRKLTPAEWLSAYCSGLPKAYAPANVIRWIDRTEALIGERGIRLFADNAYSPSVIDIVARATERCHDTSADFAFAAAEYMVVQRASYSVRRALDDGISGEELRRVILGGLPLRRKVEWHG